MNKVRNDLLTKIKNSLDPTHSKTKRNSSVKAWLSNPSRHVIPERALIDQNSKVKLFQNMAEEVAATTALISTYNELPEAVINFLHRHNLTSEIKSDKNPVLQRVNWSSHPTLSLNYGKALDKDQNSLTVAYAGVEETGTAVLISGPNNPTSLNFLPENHIIVLPLSRLFGTYEETWTKLKSEFRGSANFFPRTVNWITGPSRTGDIEQTMQLGIHGPKRLHIILVEEDG